MSANPKYTSNCSIELIDSVNSSFIAQIYNRFINNRFGVEICGSDDYEKFLVKKELLELNLSLDSNFCKPAPICKAPCAVFAKVLVFLAKTCPKPTNVEISFVVIDTSCNKPNSVNAVISYQS